jgi:16S rRNA (adenine1518-N6/adenine1519-N6)-dimethyltransferase
MSRDETSRLISETGVVPKKSKGQNFLTDERVAQRQVEFAGISKDDRVLEVGPGLGILTNLLCQKSDHVTCIELDRALADYIEGTFKDRVTLIRGDAMKIDFPPFDRFVSNLPYSISTPIIFKLLDYDFKKAIVMVQKEFADRMVAEVGSLDYSRLTVNLFYRSECHILETVPASRFKPRPKVDSALVEIIPRPAPFTVADEKTFFSVTEAAFNHRRKKISTALRAAGLITADTQIPFADERVERLTPAEIGQLSDVVHTAMGKL